VRRPSSAPEADEVMRHGGRSSRKHSVVAVSAMRIATRVLPRYMLTGTAQLDLNLQ
jgi:hypothetical protein